jgi:hypothetical protein
MDKTTHFKMDDIDDEQRKEYDAKAYRRDTIAMTIIMIMVAIALALAVIMACAELHYIEYGRGLAHIEV